MRQADQALMPPTARPARGCTSPVRSDNFTSALSEPPVLRRLACWRCRARAAGSERADAPAWVPQRMSLPLTWPLLLCHASSWPVPRQNPAYEPGRLPYPWRSRPADRGPAIWTPRRLAASEPPSAPRNVMGDEAAALISCPVVNRPLAGSAGFLGMFRHCRPACSGEDACAASQSGGPGVEPGAARPSGDRGGARGGRGCGLRDGIRRT
jgi:hypothetical protein